MSHPQYSLDAVGAMVESMNRRLFEEGADGGAIGRITKAIDAKVDQSDFDALKLKVDGLTWKAAWSSGVVTGLAFMVKYGFTKVLHH